MSRRAVLSIVLALAALLPARTLDATWSIVVCDARTGEVGVSSVTCLDNFDLLALTPVVRVGEGAAAVQAAGDFDGLRRPVIWDGLRTGTAPSTILSSLASIPGHSSRQYGIVDTQGRAVTFTGGATFAWAGGVTGSDGDLHYALQGNILTGPCVVDAMETALLSTSGDLPTRLLAAMSAARDAGGDGRCSCSPSDATGCGCPPPSFTKSGHIGYFVVARIGDGNDPVCNSDGCADGDSLYSLNVPFQPVGAPDPVDQLEALYATRRAELAGRPDAIASGTTVESAPGGHLLTVDVRDFDGLPVTLPLTISVVHAAGSAGASAIGTPVPVSPGTFEVPLVVGANAGVDRLRVTVVDGFRNVVLSPGPEFCAGALSTGATDCNGNGVPDPCDIATGVSEDLDFDGFPDECARFIRSDCDASGAVDLGDVITALGVLFDADAGPVPCLEACNSGGGDAFDLADPIVLLGTLFALPGTPPIPPPYPVCGVEVAPGAVGCSTSICP